MTVTYTACVHSSARNFGCFLKLLGKWRGSIYKLVWRDLVLFLLLYFSLAATYRFALTPTQKAGFERVAYYCDKHGSLIPLSFVLGFYVSLVIGRWWEQYKNIPWVDTLALLINANLHGNRDKDRLIRRTLMRYINLSLVLSFRLICPRIKKRFPSLAHLVEGGLLNSNELEILSELSASVPTYPTNWIPLVWAAGIVTRARGQNKIKNDGISNVIQAEICKLKDQCNMLISYDWISVPLVYTQVVTLAVYSYFLSCLMGRQWLFERDSSKGASAKGVETWNELDIFLPLFTILQFLFYMGWLKTAESLLNPFGDDDDDFELNWFVDRNLQIGYLIVDGMHKDYPELLKDQYWDEVVPPTLPHTLASEAYDEKPFEGSTSGVKVSEKGAEKAPDSSSANLTKVVSSNKLSLKKGPIAEAEEQNLLVAAVDPECTGSEHGDTINFDALTEESQPRPGVAEIFGLGDIKGEGGETPPLEQVVVDPGNKDLEKDKEEDGGDEVPKLN